MQMKKPRVTKRRVERSRSSSADVKQVVKKKKVSFSTSLETRFINTGKEFNAANSFSSEQKEDTPKKSILKKTAVKTLAIRKKKRQVVDKSGNREVSQQQQSQKKGSKIKLADKSRTIKKKSIKVKRSTKEILMQMNKKERKEFIRQLAAKNKLNFELMDQAKKLWETIRSSKTPEDKKEKCIQKLSELCRGKLAKLVHSHTTSRVVQCLFSLKRPEIRKLIFEELKSEILEMAKSKYGRFFVSKMLKYGSKEQRDDVIDALKGNYVRLFKIAHSAQLVDSIFGEWGVAKQYHSIIAEFYGPEYVLFQDQNAPQNVQQIALHNPEKVPLIMKNLEAILEGVTQKIPTLRLSITHKLLLEYLTHCSKEQRQSMIDNLKDHLPEICHTRDGARAALICVCNSNGEDQEAMVRSFTGLAVRSCQDEFVRRVLFGIFDTVENTELVNQVICREIANNIADLIYHKNAIWVLHYLVHPRDVRVIGKGLFEILKEGDLDRRNERKAASRYAELFECIRPALLDFMKANMREMITNKISAVLILDTLEVPVPSDPFKREIPAEDFQECFKAIAEIAADEFIPHSPDGPSHIVQGGCARFVFRKLLLADPAREKGCKLSDSLAELPPESLASWTGMDCGCYTLVEMLKSGSKKARKALEKALNPNNLKKSSLKGAGKLLDELNAKEQTAADLVETKTTKKMNKGELNSPKVEKSNVKKINKRKKMRREE